MSTRFQPKKYLTLLIDSLLSPSLVVFDRKLDQLKLPVLQSPPKTVFDPQQDDAPKPESVALFVEKYFDTIGTFQGTGTSLPRLCTECLASPSEAGARFVLRVHDGKGP